MPVFSPLPLLLLPPAFLLFLLWVHCPFLMFSRFLRFPKTGLPPSSSFSHFFLFFPPFGKQVCCLSVSRLSPHPLTVAFFRILQPVYPQSPDPLLPLFSLPKIQPPLSVTRDTANRSASPSPAFLFPARRDFETLL